MLVRKCNNCKSQNINLLHEGAFCFSCGAPTGFTKVVKLLGEIDQGGKAIEVILTDEIADKVLQFEKPLVQMCKAELGLTRILLSEVELNGVFLLDPHGQIIAFS